MKKVISLLTVLMMMLLCSFVPANSSFDPEKVVISDQSVRKLLSTAGISAQQYDIVILEPTNLQYYVGNSTLDNCSDAKAIKVSKNMPNGVIEETYVVPYTELEDGTLVNSFEYENRMSHLHPVGDVSERHNVTDLTDITMTVTTYFERVTISPVYYRMFYTKASWHKVDDTSSAYVSEMTILSEVSGVCYTYPEEVRLTGDTYRWEEFYVQNPHEGNIYATDLVMNTHETEHVYDVGQYNTGTFGAGTVILTYYDSRGRERSDEKIFWCFRSD